MWPLKLWQSNYHTCMSTINNNISNQSEIAQQALWQIGSKAENTCTKTKPKESNEINKQQQRYQSKLWQRKLRSTSPISLYELARLPTKRTLTKATTGKETQQLTREYPKRACAQLHCTSHIMLLLIEDDSTTHTKPYWNYTPLAYLSTKTSVTSGAKRVTTC